MGDSIPSAGSRVGVRNMTLDLSKFKEYNMCVGRIDVGDLLDQRNGLLDEGVPTPSIEKHYGGSTWSRRSAGYKITLGGYGDRKSYFKLKSGTFNFDGIAKEVSAKHAARLERNKRDGEQKAKEQSADQTAEATRKLLGLKKDSQLIVGSKYHSGWHGRGGYTQAAGKGMVLMQLGTIEVSQERALEVYEALKKAGVLGVLPMK